jgi:hypothetical protein
MTQLRRNELTSVFAARSRKLGLLLLGGLIVIAALMAGKPAQAAGNGTIQITPASQTVGASFSVTIETNVNVAISGAATDFTFDRTRFQIASVAPGPVWNGALFAIGVAPQTQQAAINQANASTGRLENIGLFFQPGTTVPLGTHTLVTISMTANLCGSSISVGVAAGEINDVNGDPASVAHSGGTRTTSPSSCTCLADTDADAQCNNSDTDDDNDTFTDVVELSAETNSLQKCGVDAWPPDITNDNLVNFGDIGLLTSIFGQAVPTAPARRDISPSPPDGVINFGDIGRLTVIFGQPCPP